jgi:hypothetical protein
MDPREQDAMKSRSSSPSCPMVTVQIDVLAGSPWIAKKNGRIAAEEDFEKAFITLPTLLEQEARRYVSEVDERCVVAVRPPIDVLTECPRYFVKIEHPVDATLNPEELKHRLNVLVRAAWAPQKNRRLESSLASRGAPEDVALATSGKGAPELAGNASDYAVANPTATPVQQKSDAAKNPPPLGFSDAPTATADHPNSNEALSFGNHELRSDSDGAMLGGDFTGEGGEAEATLLSKDAGGVCAENAQGDAPTEVSGADALQSDREAGSRVKDEKRPDPFELEPAFHPEESFFCTKSPVVFAIETDNPLLPLVVIEACGADLLLKTGECLPSDLVPEVMDRPINWIHIVRVAD